MKTMDKYPNEYFYIHRWLSKHTKRLNCNFCGINGTLDWALIKGKKHEKKLENYLNLCKKCHFNYDLTEERRIFYSQNMRKVGCNSAKAIRQLDLNGIPIREWKSAREAGRILKIPEKHITQALNYTKKDGSKKTCSGFQWEFIN